MSSPKYLASDIESASDHVYRKILEHYRVDRLAKANADVLAYEVKANDRLYPHPPIEYHIRFFLKSYIGKLEDGSPVIGEVHELLIKLPNVFPEQTAEVKMLSKTWHPNIKSSGPFEGDICTNHKGFGGLYCMDELIVRIGEFLQYKRYLAEDRKPWPEDPVVARWVKDFAEPQGLVDKHRGVFVDDYDWIVSFDDVEMGREGSVKPSDPDPEIEFLELGHEAAPPDGKAEEPDTPPTAPPSTDEQIIFS